MANKEFGRLVSIMRRLRARNGCPWDRKQTHRTILPYILEEAYEVIEAVNKGGKEHLKEELGDLLLQVIFHAQIAAEAGKFDIYDVVDGLNNKLIVRHPHVFAGRKGLYKDWHVRDFWEKHKKETKKRDSVIDGVPAALPALLRSRRLQSKAQSTGFKFRTYKAIMDKFNEELAEVKSAVKEKDSRHIREEIGDLLFVIVTLSYFLRVDPEQALQGANDKFIRRFKKIEKKLYMGIPEKEMLKLWERAKK
jgi:tetrapyrrole methylase family protein / MazG family protein